MIVKTLTEVTEAINAAKLAADETARIADDLAKTAAKVATDAVLAAETSVLASHNAVLASKIAEEVAKKALRVAQDVEETANSVVAADLVAKDAATTVSTKLDINHLSNLYESLIDMIKSSSELNSSKSAILIPS